ncbi:MAG: LysR family transcriptional regulator [Bacillota bacterium]
MTLRHFKIFVTVCDTLNMTEAAKALFISQSAISQAVSELEGYYDARLFERLSRKLYLTQAGEKLLSYARHMLRMSADIQKDMKALLQSGSLRLGASVTIGASVLPRLVGAFKATHPDTEISVIEDNTEQIEKQLLGDRTDFGLVEGEIISRDIMCSPFMEDELTLVCASAHRFAGLSAVKPQELEKEEFIVRERGSGTRKTFESVMTAHNLAWKESWTCNNADTIKAAVSAGLGVSVISKLAVAKEVRDGALVAVPVEGIRFERTFKIAYHKNKFLTAQMKDFFDLCINAAVFPEGTR